MAFCCHCPVVHSGVFMKIVDKFTFAKNLNTFPTQRDNKSVILFNNKTDKVHPITGHEGPEGE
jgi:hypothetical protein